MAELNASNQQSKTAGQKRQKLIEDLDEKLHATFVEYGTNAKFYVRKCLGLIPEIFHRQIHRQKGFQSIYDYARMLAGISEAQVKRVLSLNANFKNKPALQTLLATGVVGISKLVTVASIATPDNHEELAKKVEVLPRSALETFVRDVRQEASAESQKMQLGQYFLSEKVLPLPGAQSPEFVPGDKGAVQNTSYKNQDLYLNEEVKDRLIEMQNKGIDVNEFLIELLQQREQELKTEKEKIAAEILQKKQIKAENTKNSDANDKAGSKTREVSRYVPVKVKEIVRKEYGGKCSIDGCLKNAEVIHHTQRFAIGKSHDPRFLAPLCKDHHVLAHSVDRKFLERRER